MRALLVVDVQNDFCEGGSLGVPGGAAVAAAISTWAKENASRYALLLASRDWHEPHDNAGHFADTPDYLTTWPAHCVAGTRGAEYHPALDTSLIDVHVRKGMGEPAYSLFEGVTDEGSTAAEVLRGKGITTVDVVGIATDYCVLQSALGAVDSGFETHVIPSLCAGVAPETTAAALTTMVQRGVAL